MKKGQKSKKTSRSGSKLKKEKKQNEKEEDSKEDITKENKGEDLYSLLGIKNTATNSEIMWKPLLFNSDYSKKPAYYGFLEALEEFEG